jgi:prevent-host-death family protein
LRCIVSAIKTVSIDEAKTHLSELVDAAVHGESFVIAKAGKPLVRVTALDASVSAQRKRLGFMAGQLAVPDDFDAMGNDDIVTMFNGDAK